MSTAITLTIVVLSLGRALRAFQAADRLPGSSELAGDSVGVSIGVSRRSAAAVISVIVIAGFVAGPFGALAGLVGVYVRSVTGRRHRALIRERQIRDGLAEVVDLFAVSLTSGHNLYAATQQVAQWARDPFRLALTECVDAVALGRPLADSLEDLPSQLGPAVQPLVGALVAHDRYGAPIAPNLTALARENRRAQRHHAEVLARRLPVILLGPLVVCVLPAFLLLTVVPLVAESLASLTDALGP